MNAPTGSYACAARSVTRNGWWRSVAIWAEKLSRVPRTKEEAEKREGWGSARLGSSMPLNFFR